MVSIVRPRDGWRVFAGEVGVIVLGVMIALGAQQAVDEWRWRQEVTRTKADLEIEILGNAALAAERVAINRCLVGRLTELGRKIAARDGRWIGDPFRVGRTERVAERRDFALPIVYRAPSRIFTTDVWEQTKANGIFNHMKADEVTYYASIYQQIDDLRSLNREEGRTIPQLAFLAFNGAIDPASRQGALSTVASLDSFNGMIVLVGRQIALAAAQLDGKLSEQVIKDVRDTFRSQQILRGSCVDPAAGWSVLKPLRSRE